MQTPAFAPPPRPSNPAEARGRDNLAANLSAFARTDNTFDPSSAERLDGAGEFLHARDGSLTHRTPAGWAAGCSLPRRAARQQLRTMDVGGPVACFLDPPHAADLRAALDRLTAAHAVVAVVLDAAALPVLLSCEDFSADVAAHRLWVVAGADWAARLRALFDRHPGLPTPSQ